MPLSVGDSATRTKTITDADILTFADVVDDHNPLHIDDAYAQNSPFKQRVAHGMLVASILSAAIANDLPGPGSIYMGQTLKFKKPVFIGDTVTAKLTVTSYRAERRIAVIETVITNQAGVVVIEGEATVMVPA